MTLLGDDSSKFLDGDEFEADVWRSYGATIREHGIRAIPYFVFNGPATKGGPFRGGKLEQGEVVVNGSSSPDEFLAVIGARSFRGSGSPSKADRALAL